MEQVGLQKIMDEDRLESGTEFEGTNFSKPLYNRQIGEMSLCISVSDARPLKTKRVRLHQYFLKDLLENLFISMSNVTLCSAKEHFRRRALLNGVILEQYIAGTSIFLVLSCESVEDLNVLWQDYEQGRIQQAVSELYTSPDILESVGAADIQLRTRLFQDEYETCRRELSVQNLMPIILAERPQYLDMLRQVKAAQRALSLTLASLKDEASQFAASSNEFMVTYKRLIPPTIVQTNCLLEFQHNVNTARTAGSAYINTEAVDRYVNLLSSILQATMDIDFNVVQPLAQVHRRAESVKQRTLKPLLLESLKQLEKFLDVNFDISGLIHPSWRAKVIVREEGLFLGLLSLISYCVESIDCISHNLDEYMSGVTIKL